MFFNECVVHGFIMGTNIRWKFIKCDVINFLVKEILDKNVIITSSSGKEGGSL